MARTTLLRTAFAALAGSAILAQTAAATSEPKNQLPFTRPVATRAAQAALQQTQADPPIQGEPKNEPPFTRPVTVVVAANGSGFDWLSGAIGGAGGLGVALAAGGALLVLRKSPRIA
jgi:hypothetical protein